MSSGPEKAVVFLDLDRVLTCIYRYSDKLTDNSFLKCILDTVIRVVLEGSKVMGMQC